MINTVKFSQFMAGGDLSNGSQTTGLQSAQNALFNNPWVFLAPGNTASRPLVPIVGQLRFNTNLLEYEYWNGAAWVQLTTNNTNTDVWQNSTGATQNLVQSNAYLANNAGIVNFTLPTACEFGTEIKIGGVLGSGGWKINQNASQYIVLDDVLTTIGPSGFLQSTTSTQSVSLVCIVANLAWAVYGIVGNVTQV